MGKYGHFSDDGLEYVITNPHPPRDWSNYFWNATYLACAGQHGNGCWWKTEPAGPAEGALGIIPEQLAPALASHPTLGLHARVWISNPLGTNIDPSRSHHVIRRIASLVLLSSLGLAGVGCGNEAGAGRLTLDPPTLHCMGVRWEIGGDLNRNATVAFEFRKTGRSKWRRGLDLFRVEREAIYGPKPSFDSHLFAGSIFDLDPDTDYELRLTLKDPDGGDAVRTLKARTWAEPVPPKPKRVLHVIPGDGGGKGSAENPLKGIRAANRRSWPGDLLLLHKGVYKGPHRITHRGTAKAPIVWRAAGDGEVVLEGPEKGRCLAADNLRHVFIEGLTFRKSARAMTLTHSRNVTVRRCLFDGPKSGIGADGRQERLFISDCVFKGPRTWPRPKDDSKLGEHRGIEVSGVGHVIAYNRVSGYRDGIDVRPKMPNRGIDIYANDVSECTDDGIELDYSQSNCRVYRNRITNCHMGISFQPSFGGPNYAIRNVMYNVAFETYKLHVSSPGKITSGGVILHNTVVRKGAPLRVWAGDTPAHYFTMRNNLYVFRDADRVIDMQLNVEKVDWDYDVFAGGPTGLFAKFYRTPYQTRAAFTQGTGQEAHATVTRNTKSFFASGLRPPADADKQYPVALNDPRLAPGSGAIDRGVRLPNINDGFKGKAPDAGALELGDLLDHYGPRPRR